jgi:Holliday junction resolvase RusA-like endonuclease
MTRTGHAYTPAKTRTYESKLALFGSRTMGSKPPLEGPLHVVVLVVLPIPDSWSKKKKADAISCRLLPTGRKDLDNFIKCLDALNGVCWRDDGQICSLVATKKYGKNPGITIVICRIEDVE